MKKALTILTAALGLTISAHANIGDTEQQSVQKYGNPTSTDGSFESFKTDGWMIAAYFDVNRICQSIEYVKLDGSDITRPEADKIDFANIDQGTLQKHRWVNNNWKRTQRADQASYTTQAAGVFYQLITGYSYYWGNNWLCSRAVTTGNGIDLIKQWIAEHKAEANQGHSDVPGTDSVQKTNV
jgi:hypothetical protein